MSAPEDYLRQAIALATRNVESANGGPFGAVIVKDDQVVASGANLVTASLDPTAHAEIVAIREAARKLGSFSLEECDLYASCEPCPMCLGAVYWARLRRIYFAAGREDAAAAGFSDAAIYREVCVPLDRRTIPATALLREEGRESFRLWIESIGREPY